MNTFRHAGDRGDIIASLPVIRAIGGGLLYIESAPYTRERLTPDNWLGLDHLLREQPYISGVEPWHGQYGSVSYNLNDFRSRLFKSMRLGTHRDKSLIDWQLEQYGLPLTTKDAPWLTLQYPIRAAPVVFSRTGAGRPKQYVYHNPRFPWHYVWEKYHADAVFVGTPDEHRAFCGSCGRVPHYPTKDLHEAARVIAGADLFVGNQSVCFWIAEGLKKRLVLEVWPEGPNSTVIREGATQGYDETVVLPDL